MFALSTDQLTVPKLIDRDGIGSSFSKSSVSQVLAKMKNLQLDAIGTVASNGNIRVSEPDAFGVGFDEAEGSNTDKKIGAVFKMVFTSDKLEDLINKLEAKLDGVDDHKFDTYATLQYLNREVAVYLFTNEERNGRRVVRKVKAAMPVTPKNIILEDNATDKDLEGLLAYMGVLKQVVMKINSLSIEESLITLAILDNLFCHEPSEGVMKSHPASYGEYLVRLMYTVELTKINRLAVVNVNELGGDSHKKAVADAVRLQEAVAKQLKEEQKQVNSTPTDSEVPDLNQKNLMTILYKLTSQLSKLETELPNTTGQQDQEN